MKKSLSLALFLSIGIAGTAFAAPLSNYEQGKTSIDLGYSFNKTVGGSVGLAGPDLNIKGIPLPSFDADHSFQTGVTVGLGKKIAVQGKFEHLKIAGVDINTGRRPLLGFLPRNSNVNLQLSEQQIQFNVLYQVTPNFSPYIGYKHASLKLSGFDAPFNTKASNNIFQVGILAQAPLSDKVTGWMDFAVGTKNSMSYEIGAAYKVSKNLDFNIGYQYSQNKYKFSMTQEDSASIPEYGILRSAPPARETSVTPTIKTKGWFSGITYKF